MATIRFSSRAYSKKDRAAIIQDVWGPVTNIDIKPADWADFDVEAVAHVLPSLSMGLGTFSSYRAERTKAHAVASKDDLVFCLVTDASWKAEQPGGVETVCAPGDIYLNVGDLPAVAEMPARSTTVVNVAISRGMLAPFVNDLDVVSKRKLPDTPELALFKSYVLTLLRELNRMGPESTARSAAHVHDLALMALGATPDTAEIAKRRGVRAARLAMIKADIAAKLIHPNLSLDWIATRHGISPRYLRDLFAGEGTSFSDHVLARRLDHARTLLSNPHLAHRRIGTIALESGFGDLSYFNRAYRRRYGMTPGETRLAAAQTAASDGS